MISSRRAAKVSAAAIGSHQVASHQDASHPDASHKDASHEDASCMEATDAKATDAKATDAKATDAHAAPIPHGGDLAAARLLFPDAPQPFVDLSTGINPHAYPVPPLRPGLFSALPPAAALAELLA